MSGTKKQTIANGGYAAWIESLSARYWESQIKAAVAVNTEMLKFYFGLGRDITLMEKDQPWGSGFLKRVSSDLKQKMPEAECFSVNNLIYMRCFFKLYASTVFTPQVEGKMQGTNSLPQAGAKLDFAASSQLVDSISPQVGEKLEHPVFRVPWGHHKLLIDKFRDDPDSAMFYVRETVKNGWSRAVLLNFLDTNLHERQGKAVSNFAVALPKSDSDLTQEITKDTYCFDFIALTPKYRVSFSAMRKNDTDIWYEQNGRCVLFVKSGESYLSRKKWELIRDMKEGVKYSNTITETISSDTPTERTIIYKSLFFRKCREEDCHEAWEMLEKRGDEYAIRS